MTDDANLFQKEVENFFQITSNNSRMSIKSLYYAAAAMFSLWLLYRALNKGHRKDRLTSRSGNLLHQDLAKGIAADFLQIYYPNYVRSFENELGLTFHPPPKIWKQPDVLHTSLMPGMPGKKKKLRKPLGERLRKIVAAEQKWRCKNCNQLLSAAFDIDHLVPVCEGGTNDRENLVALCKNCHGIKTMQDGIRLGF